MLMIGVRNFRHSESLPVITCLPVLLLRVLSVVPRSGENRDARQ